MFNPYPPMYGQPGFGFRNPIYPQPAQAPQPAPAMPQQFTCTPVTGTAPVDAAQAPFDGTPLFFYDTAADAVYVKQFDHNTGTAPVTIYRTERKAVQQYATVEMLTALSQRVEEMAGMISTPRRNAKKEADAE